MTSRPHPTSIIRDHDAPDLAYFTEFAEQRQIEDWMYEGKGQFPCPSCGAVASDTNRYPYCPAGCTEADMLAAPPECTRQHYWEDRSQCLTCVQRREWVRARARQHQDEIEEGDLASLRVTGEELLDVPDVIPIWGEGSQLVSVVGQPWMLVGPDGTGKTSAAGQYSKARLGLLGPEPRMWDLPVVPLPEDQSVYYFAADRPRQAMEALRRGLTEEHRPLLRQRLHFHKGPPPYRLSTTRGQQWLLREVEETRAGLIVLDSRKDFGSTVNADEVAGMVTAVQLLVASDVEVLLLHHPNERRRKGPPELPAVAGHGPVYQGMGSVLFFDGRPGDVLVEVFHLKPIRDLLPRFHLVHDHTSGISQRTRGIVLDPQQEEATLIEGRMPYDRWEVRTLQAIDAHAGEWCPAVTLRDVLASLNLARDLRGLVGRKVIEHNGKRGAQSAYRRGPDAPPRT